MDLAKLLPTNLPVMRLCLPHHKVDKYHTHSLVVELPYDLAMACHIYEQYAYAVLNPSGSHNYLLVNPISGKPYVQESTLTKQWYKIQALYDATWPAFPPNNFRHIHVMDRVQGLADLMAQGIGADMQGDAAIMTHTVGPVLERHYMAKGKGYLNVMVEAAVDRMTTWRHAHLTAMTTAVLEEMYGYPGLYDDDQQYDERYGSEGEGAAGWGEEEEEEAAQPMQMVFDAGDDSEDCDMVLA